MTCSNCSRTIDPSSSFCDFCGTPVETGTSADTAGYRAPYPGGARKAIPGSPARLTARRLGPPDMGPPDMGSAEMGAGGRGAGRHRAAAGGPGARSRSRSPVLRSTVTGPAGQPEWDRPEHPPPGRRRRFPARLLRPAPLLLPARPLRPAPRSCADRLTSESTVATTIQPVILVTVENTPAENTPAENTPAENTPAENKTNPKKKII